MIRCNLTFLFWDCLNQISKLFVHSFWKLVAKVSIHDKCHTALTRLAIDTNNWLILSSDVCWIDWKVWNLPNLASSFSHCLNTLVDCILMGSRKCSEYKFACIRMSCIDWKFTTTFINFNDFIDIFNFKFRIDSLWEHIVCKRQDIYITSTFSITKQGTFNTIRSCKHC